MNILLITVRADFGGGPRHVHQLIEELPSSINIYMAFPQGKPYGNLWRSHPRILIEGLILNIYSYYGVL